MERTIIKSLDDLKNSDIGATVELRAIDPTKHEEKWLATGTLVGRARDDHSRTTTVRINTRINHDTTEIMEQTYVLQDYWKDHLFVGREVYSQEFFYPDFYDVQKRTFDGFSAKE